MIQVHASRLRAKQDSSLETGRSRSRALEDALADAYQVPEGPVSRPVSEDSTGHPKKHTPQGLSREIAREQRHPKLQENGERRSSSSDSDRVGWGFRI